MENRIVKVMALKKLIMLLSAYFLAWALLPLSPLGAAEATVINVSAPPNIAAGGSFVARINVSQAPLFLSYQIQLNYDINVIQVAGVEGGAVGVTGGMIGAAALPVELWAFYPPGTASGAIRILGRFDDVQSAGGSGYLAEVHFNVLGSAGQQSGMTPAGTQTFFNGLFDSLGNRLTVPEPWGADTVQVSTLQITTSVLPDAAVGSFYLTTASASGGVSPYSWNAAGLPGGLNMNPNGTISGTPIETFNSNISLTATDASDPATSVTKMLALKVYVEMAITTTALPRAGVETGSRLPAVPGWVINVPYPAVPFSLAAAGGNSPYHWTAAGLPSGISLTDGGVISGIPEVAGLYNITFTATDSAVPPKSTSQTLPLKIYLQGDGNGDGIVRIGDVTFVERVILGLNAPTAGSDANLNGSISIGDVTRIERIILGLP